MYELRSTPTLQSLLAACRAARCFSEPVRRRLHGIETFNLLRGGEYFFMPSLSALKWLAELG